VSHFHFSAAKFEFDTIKSTSANDKIIQLLIEALASRWSILTKDAIKALNPELFPAFIREEIKLLLDTLHVPQDLQNLWNGNFQNIKFSS
jgi:hypothetical protein